MKHNEKGISLIALIITIAVLIIIATVTIQNGMQRTNEARIAKHNANITTTEEEVESYYYYKGGELPVVNLTPYPLPTSSALLAETARNAEDTDTFYILDSSKMGEVSGKNNNTYIVSATRHTVYNLEGTTIKGITYYGLIGDNNVKLAQVPPYNNPIVPKGFKNVGIETWDNGFTIEDANGNQFVWVPALAPVMHADGTLDNANFNSKFGRRKFKGEVFNSYNYYETVDTTLQNIITSVNKYGGFYIAKYEASKDESDRGQSKPGKAPWNNIDWYTSKEKAELMDTDWGWDTSVVESYLCYGSHWDTTLEWLMDSGNKTSPEVISDSISWGNYTNSVFTGGGWGIGTTGQWSETYAKGIYDLAGNLGEWTMENSEDSFYAGRGGDCGDVSNVIPVAQRTQYPPTFTFICQGWRAVLYIK